MVKPFVKWVGGKRQRLPEIMRRVPRRALASGEWAYAEPFVGGGAVLLAVLEAFPAIPQAAANDLNPRLVAARRAVQSQPAAPIPALQAPATDPSGPARRAIGFLPTFTHKFKGGPVGLGPIATAVSEDAGTIEEVYEPFLIKEGFLKRTPRGREVTPLAYQHLGIAMPGGNVGQGELQF